MSILTMIQFSRPLALLLLLALPFVISSGWPSRGAARRRETISLILRCLLLCSLILALAGMELSQSAAVAPRAVVFVVDVSASISSAGRTAQDEYIRQSLQEMGPDDRAAIVVFGEEALVERPMSGSKDLRPISSSPGRNGSSLARAIELALSLYPPGTARRMVLLTDGQQTDNLKTGDNARQAVQIARDLGVEVTAADLGALMQSSGQEIILQDISLPANLRSGDQFSLNLSLASSQPITQALPVTVLANGSVVYTGTVSVNAKNEASLPITANQEGFVQYQVLINPSSGADQLFQNNEMAAYTQIAGSPQILLVAPEPGEELPGGDIRPDEVTLLQLALKGAGLEGAGQPTYSIQQVAPLRMPAEPETLAQFSAVVLIDVPARQLTDAQMSGLQNYVELGGGLVVVGGPTSYGVGGYNDTPLEVVLPVDMEIKDEKRRPSLGIVFIIDHSGSMSDLSGGKTKLEIAKEAVIRSLDLLEPQDRVGVLAFDDQAMWVAEMAPLENKNMLVNKVGTLEPGGGTDILAGVQAMARVLPGDPAVNKHVILLTDGGADPAGIAELVKNLYEQNGITLSTIAVGRDAAPFLPDLARAGGGRFHFAATPNQIPTILSEETALATRAYIVEKSFFPELVNPLLADTLGIRSTPPLLGYVATSADPGSQVILQAPEPDQDPILAVWSFGLGKAAAFTSDATSRWSANWVFEDPAKAVLRPQFVQFWQGLVRYVMGNISNSALNIQVQLTGSQGKLSAEIEVDTASSGSLLNEYSMQAVVVSPEGSSQLVNLAQTAPGKYSGSFAPQAQGVYMIRVSGKENQGSDSQSIGETTGWVLAYSPEYAQLKSKDDKQKLLLLLAAGSQPGGVFVTSQEVFNYLRSSGQNAAPVPVWPWLLGLTALLLPLDIAVRRLVIAWADLRQGALKLGSLVRNRFRIPQPAADAAPRPAQMENLLKVKNAHSRRPTNPAENPAGPVSLSDPLPTAAKPVKERPVEPVAPPETAPSPPGFSASGDSGSSVSGSSVSALLKSKKDRSDPKNYPRP